MGPLSPFVPFRSGTFYVFLVDYLGARIVRNTTVFHYLKFNRNQLISFHGGRFIRIKMEEIR